MAKRIAQFYKVSYEQFKEACLDTFDHFDESDDPSAKKGNKGIRRI